MVAVAAILRRASLSHPNARFRFGSQAPVASRCDGRFGADGPRASAARRVLLDLTSIEF